MAKIKFRVWVSGFLITILHIVTLKVSAQQVDFVREVKPILSDRCFSCHGPDQAKRQGDLRLDLPEGLESILSANDPNASELLRRIESDVDGEQMPPADSKLELSPKEKSILRRWIEEGAVWKNHWSLEPLSLETFGDTAVTGSQQIDRLVVQRLKQEGLELAAPADSATLLRRVTLDLTGVSPTLEELSSFLQDPSPNAYEQVVDRLLASPRFGERAASMWLDAARYCDTYGFQRDMTRFVWPWRDWVVRSFNQNLPYNEFLIQQLAGDLLPNPTDDQILATTFNRLHPQKVEGGSIEEEFRVEYVADRVQTLGTAFMGLSLECARCHDHKFDALSMKEYYQLFAFFNNIDEAGLYSFFDPQAVPTPTHALMSPQQKTELARLTEAAAKAETRCSELMASKADPNRSVEFRKFLSEMNSKPPEEGLISGLEQIEIINLDLAGNKRTEIENGAVIEFTGDDEIGAGAGRFDREQPFTISVKIRVPSQPLDSLDRNVIFHCSRAWTDSASRGYQLLIENGRLSAALIHFWPGNAIAVRTKAEVPLNQWMMVTLTYDGSSRADGLSIYVDGERQPLEIVRDSLTRTIMGSGTNQLSLGARFRDKGFKGGELSSLSIAERVLLPVEIKHLHDGASLTDLLKKSDSQTDENVQRLLEEIFLTSQDERYGKALEDLKQTRYALFSFQDSLTDIMVMQEKAGLRESFVLQRGAYDSPGERVTPDTPSMLPPLNLGNSPQSPNRPPNRPPNGLPNGLPNRLPNRLDLANWLVSKENPLTARVGVNLLWQMTFGAGLVKTPEDFGNQSAVPVHLDLLSWLAADFQTDWNTKRVIKQMVMSATYQQSSAISEAQFERDPENDLLARGARHRLSAEMLRDSILLQSGLLVETMGGPPVKTYDLSLAFSPLAHDKGAALYRRSLYTFWQRTSSPPTMIAFDAPTRDVCRVRREQTSSPIHGLVLLNGTQFVEASRKLAERLILLHRDDRKSIIQDLFRCLTSRLPRPEEEKVLSDLFEQQLKNFAQNPQTAREILKVGESESKLENQVELAAWAIAANALMGFDESIERR